MLELADVFSTSLPPHFVIETIKIKQMSAAIPGIVTAPVRCDDLVEIVAGALYVPMGVGVPQQ